MQVLNLQYLDDWMFGINKYAKYKHCQSQHKINPAWNDACNPTKQFEIETHRPT